MVTTYVRWRAYSYGSVVHMLFVLRLRRSAIMRREKLHAAFGAIACLVLLHLRVHWAGPSSHRLFLGSFFLCWRLAAGHVHGESAEAGHVHIAFHAPHHLTTGIRHHQDH